MATGHSVSSYSDAQKAGPLKISPASNAHHLSTINYLLTIVYFACGVRTFCETRSVIFAVTRYSPGSANLS